MSNQRPRLPKLAQALALLGMFALAVPSSLADDGKALATQNQCMTCHKVEGKLVGPAYMDVAVKYKGDPEALAKLTAKVRQGGNGVWGSMPMLPNKLISDDDLETVLNWILAQ